MFRQILSVAAASALIGSTSASVTVSVSLLNDSPPNVFVSRVAIDIFVDVSDGAWIAGGVSGVARNGAALRYAHDPNTGQALLTNPGTADRMVTFFSKPRVRDANNRFNNGGAAAAGGYSPAAPSPTATPYEINVAYFASPPETIGSPTVDGYVFRVALDLPFGVYPSELAAYQGRTPPVGTKLRFFESFGADSAHRGSVAASFDTPMTTGVDWGLAWVFLPEPTGLACFLVGAAMLCHRR